MRKKYTLIVVTFCAMVTVALAKPKKNNKNNSAQKTAETTKAAEPVYSVNEDRVVTNANGEVVGKLDVEGRIINKDGNVVGRILKYSAPNIQDVIFE